MSMYGGYTSGYTSGYPMSYGTSAPMAYGGYSGYGAPAMDEDVVQTQLKDAQKVLTTQYGVQTDMLTHQYKAQLNMLEAEKNRAIKQMSMQYEQQYTQQKLAIEQAQKQQENALEMASFCWVYCCSYCMDICLMARFFSASSMLSCALYWWLSMSVWTPYWVVRTFCASLSCVWTTSSSMAGA